MKEKFIKKISEVGRVIWEIKLLGLVMNAIICFIIFSVILAVMGINILFGLIPTAVYLISALLRSMIRSDVIGTIEEKHKKLDESLKTAYDNREKGNIIVSHLLSDVSNEMENVETSAFLDLRKVSSKVVVTIILIFLMLFVTVIDLKGMASNLVDLDSIMGDINDAMREHGIEYEKVMGGGERWETSNLTTENEKEKLGAEPGGERPGFQMGPIPGGGGGVGSDDRADIYGQASSAAIEGENVDFSLRPDYGGEIEIKEENKEEQQLEVKGPEGVESAETCEECAIGPEYEELVKRYFEKILGEV